MGGGKQLMNIYVGYLFLGYFWGYFEFKYRFWVIKSLSFF